MIMKYELTEERKKYLDARGHTILQACPGSGKTTSIVYKLHSICREVEASSKGYAGVACLSFTNAACGEILDKYKEMHGECLKHPHVVSTIDSFITQNVVFPFWYKSTVCKERPQIINDLDILNGIYFVNSNTNGSLTQYPVKELKPFSTYLYKYKPSEISVENGNYCYKNKPINASLKEYCKTVVFYRMGKGLLTSQDVLCVACDILKANQAIGKIIAKRYPYIIIDEAQDTSFYQFRFFDYLRKAGVQNIEFVGDICQSIYEWRNAKPKMLKEKADSDDWLALYFKDNRRSNQRIIDLCGLLRPQGMPKILSRDVIDMNIDILVYKYNHDNLKDIIIDFQNNCNKNGFTNYKILVRGNDSFKSLSGITKKVKYWKSIIPYEIIIAKREFDNNDIVSAYRRIRSIWAELKYDYNDYKNKKVFKQTIQNDITANVKIQIFLANIPSFKESLSNWTTLTCSLIAKNFELEKDPDFYVVKKGSNGIKLTDMHQMSIEDLYKEENQMNNIYKVQTIHSVKGATLDAILLILSKDSSAQNISLNNFPSNTINEMDEKQRLIYVACSRAKQFVAFAVPDNISDDKIINVFKNIPVKIKTINTQMSLF